MLWYVGHDDPRSEQQGRLQLESRLVVQEIFPPVDDHIFRQDHGQGVAGMTFLQRVDIGQQGTAQRSIRRLDHEQVSFLCFLQMLLPLVPVGSHAVGLVRVKRLRLADSKPMAMEVLHVPEALVPGLTRADFEDHSFYELLRQRYGITIANGTQSIEPTVTSEEESEVLGVPLHTPAFLFERTTVSESGRIVEFVRSIYRGDRYRLVADLVLQRSRNGRSAGALRGASAVVRTEGGDQSQGAAAPHSNR